MLAAHATYPNLLENIRLSDCVANYIAANSTPGQTAPAPVQVDKTQYIYKFSAPAWSWDMAGIMLTISLLVMLISLLLLLFV